MAGVTGYNMQGIDIDWSIDFALLTFDRYVFSSGDLSKWVVALRSDVESLLSSSITTDQIKYPISTSDNMLSLPSNPAEVKWQYTNNNMFIRNNIATLYREKGAATPSTILKENGGARVFVIDSTATPRYKIV